MASRTKMIGGMYSCDQIVKMYVLMTITGDSRRLKFH